MPLVSVILPVRDGAATLSDALRSLATQTFRDFEIVCVDDGSVDGTTGLLNEWTSREPKLRVVRQPPSGLVSALQAGLAAARGDLMARMDADDVCHPDRLRLQVARLQAEPELGVVGCRVAFGGTAPGYARHVAWLNGMLTHEDMALARFRESPLAHPSVLFRRALIDAFGGYREGPFPEDYELWLRWFEAGVRFAKVPEVLLTWNDPLHRLSRRHPNYETDRFYEIKAVYLARWLEQHNVRHPHVVVVGAGRVTRRRVDELRARGIVVDAWADLDPGKVGQRYDGVPVIHHDDLATGSFVLPFVASLGAADHIRAMLERRGFVCGRDFIEAA